MSSRRGTDLSVRHYMVQLNKYKFPPENIVVLLNLTLAF